MKNQQGNTVLGMAIIVVFIVLIGMLVIKVAPVYIENYSVSKSIQLMDRLSDAAFSSDKASNTQAIKDRLINQFEMNGIYNLDTKELEVLPSEKENTYTIKMNYQVIKHLCFNISLLFVFHEEREVTIAKGE